LGASSCEHKASKTVGDHSWVRLAPILRESKVELCIECGYMWSSSFPVGADLASLNSELSVSFDTPATRASEKVEMVHRLLERETGIDFRKAVWYDIGGGTGRAAAVFRQHGLNAFSFDPFSVKDENLARDVFVESEDSMLQPSVGDPLTRVFMLFHVLEHVHSPADWLGAWSQRIQFADTDFLIVEVPVLELEPLVSNDPSPWLAPFHISHFTIATLRATLLDAGFQIVNFEASDSYNGLLVLATRGTRVTPALPEANPVDLCEAYLRSRATSDRVIAQRLLRFLETHRRVTFWGLGIGFDAIYRLVNLDRRANLHFVDADAHRRLLFGRNYPQLLNAGKLLSPHEFLSADCGVNDGLVVSAFAKSREVTDFVRSHNDFARLTILTNSPLRSY